MNTLTKSYLATLAALTFALAPVQVAQAAQNKSLGIILESQDGHIGTSATSAGASIYVGDILNTDADGRIRIRVGQTIYELLGDSSVAFYPGQSGTIAELRRGTILVSDNSAENFQIYASDVRIVSDAPRPITGEVSLKSPCELEVKAQVGQMDVIASDQKHTVEHDHGYRVIPEHSVDPHDATVSPEDPNYHQNHTHAGCAAAAAAQNAGKAPIAAGHSYFVPVAGGIIIAAVIFAVHKAYESPDRP